MRTRKEAGKASKQVEEYERKSRKLRMLFEEAGKMLDLPAVKAHVEQEAKAREEQRKAEALPKSAEEKLVQELRKLYGEYRQDWPYVDEQLFMLGELTHAAEKGNANLPNLYNTIAELDRRVQAMNEAVEKTFGLLGVGTKASSAGKTAEAA